MFQRPQLMFLVIIGVLAGCFALTFDFKRTTWHPPRLGLDLQGGTRLILEAEPTPDVPKVTGKVMDSLHSVIEKRVNGLGISEAIVQSAGFDRLLVEIPGIQDPEEAKRILGKVGKLEFKTFNEKTKTWSPSGISGADLASADASPDTSGAKGWMIRFVLNSKGTDSFGDLTARLAPRKEPLGIFFDDELISAPVVQEPILQGEGVISGKFDRKEAKELSDLLNAGALPVDVKLIEENTVGPLLGMASLEKSLHAGLIGLGLVLAFMAAYYRVYGMLAGVALVLYAFISYAVFQLLGVTFTLAGIAGFVLSVGMAVDANILIFERLKEEKAAGRRLDHAIESGFSRAFPSIFDSNMTTLITCALLYWLGTGAIKGFAITLAVGVMVSLFTALFVTRTLMGLMHLQEFASPARRDDYRSRI